ncbi:MAG: hypothetical protein ACPF9D_02330, partial [Owenweeksia sp.]
WDSETGEVLLTRTTNNFNDPVYSLKYPAHLAYDRMGGAYKNIGYQEQVILESDGAFDDPSTSRFVPGDEVRFEYVDGGSEKVTRAWVALGEQPGDPVMEKLYLIDADGDSLGHIPSATIKVLRSGRRNMLSATMQEVVLKEDPRRVINGVEQLDIDKVLGYDPGIISASAAEFNENGRTARVPYDIETGRPYGLKRELINIPYTGDPPNEDLREELTAALFNLLNSMCANDMMDFRNGTSNPVGPKLLSSLVNFSGLTQDQIDLLLQQYRDDLGDGPIYVNCELRSDYTPASPPHYSHSYNNHRFVAYFLKSNQAGAEKYIFTRFYSGDIHGPRPHPFLPLKITGFNSNNALVPDPDIPTQVLEVTRNIFLNGTAIEFSALVDQYNTLGQVASTTGIIGDSYSWWTPFKTGEIIWTRTCPVFVSLDPVGMSINPYRMGVRGNWRPYRSYTYLSDREYGNNDVRKDGTYKDFDPFWSFNGSSGEWEDDDANWTHTNTLTMFDEYGNEVENQDALGRYSAALYDFEGMLPTAVGQNIQHGQLAYDGFENGVYVNDDCKRGYFKPYPNVKRENSGAEYTLETGDAHTGLTSARIESEKSMKYEIFFDYSEQNCGTSGSTVNIPFLCTSCDVMDSFGQYELRKDAFDANVGDTLIISYWIKRTSNPLTATDYN